MSHPRQQQQQSVFQEGALPVEFINVEGTPAPPLPPSYGKNKGLSVLPPLLARLPPKPLLIALPRAHGLYPLVLVFHGFLLRSNHYSQLLQHIASHGFVAIAPQMYDFAGADASQEIADAAAIIDWLPDGLAQFFPDDLSHVRPNFDKLALIGHSRGAKVAFGLALGLSKTSLKLSCIAGLDPVDGKDVGQQTTPPILKFSEHSFDLKLPILIVGSGLGSQKRNALFPPCAPEGVNHRAFFFDSSAPAFYFVASEHGHMDFLDDRTLGFRGKLSYCTCRNGPSRAPMRSFAAGILIAFFRAAMFSESATLQDLLVNPSQAPVKLADPEWYVGESSSTSEIPNLDTLFC